jgi:hypothetical protein
MSGSTSRQLTNRLGADWWERTHFKAVAKCGPIPGSRRSPR